MKNNKVYVGSTAKNLNKRVEEHNNGSNVWSKNNKPLKLVFYETYACKEVAVLREKFYKTGVGKKVKKAITLSMDD